MIYRCPVPKAMQRSLRLQAWKQHCAECFDDGCLHIVLRDRKRVSRLVGRYNL